MGEREAFGRPIGAFEALQFKAADMRVGVETARLAYQRAAWLRDHGRPFATEASIAKLHASEVAVSAALDAVQIHGGYGFAEEFAGRALLPRREGARDRRGHERDPAGADRPLARPAGHGAVARPRSRPVRAWPRVIATGFDGSGHGVDIPIRAFGRKGPSPWPIRSSAPAACSAAPSARSPRSRSRPRFVQVARAEPEHEAEAPGREGRVRAAQATRSRPSSASSAACCSRPP